LELVFRIPEKEEVTWGNVWRIWRMWHLVHSQFADLGDCRFCCVTWGILAALCQWKVIPLRPCFGRCVFTWASIWGIANLHKYLALTRRFCRRISSRAGPSTPHTTKTMILGYRLRPLVLPLRGLGREPIYLRNHMRNQIRTRPQLIPKREHEQITVRECSALRPRFQSCQLFDRGCECVEPHVLSIISA
jgi:hypothetical protein